MIKILLADEVLRAEDFDVDFAPDFFVFDDEEVFDDVDLALAFTVFDDDEVFDDDDLALAFTVFDDEAVFDDDDLVLAFTVFDDELLSAFLVFAGAFFFGGADNSTAIADSSGSNSKTAFTLSSNTFFFAASDFVEADFLTGEI